MKLVSMLAIITLATGCSNILTPSYEDAVKVQLRDPESAIFRSVEESHNCYYGVVSSRNGFGGMGSAYFIYSKAENSAVVISDEFIFTNVKASVC